MARRWRRRALGVPAAAVALALAASGAAVAAPPPDAPGVGPEDAKVQGQGRFQAGAAGVGDEYFPLYGNSGYDVAHYLLDVTYDPATDVLTGTATITATATQDLSRFNLDLVGMTVHAVTVDDKQARFSRTDDHELVITPQHKLRSGETFEVVVEYSGVPTTFQIPVSPELTLESGFIHTDDGALVVGQPESATAWFPVNDHPVDAATYTFVVTVPTGLDVVAVGEPVGTPVVEGAWTTHTWEATDPMASYLTGLGIGEFDISDRVEDGLRVIDAVDPDLDPALREMIDVSFARQTEILDLLAGWFGPYPYDTVGGIVDDYPILFALETQTRPIYSYLFWELGGQFLGDIVVVHELAHQWFGDDLRLERWQDIWLNEGFATYSEWLFLEAEGVVTAQEIFESSYAFFSDAPSFWELVIGDPGPVQLFDGPVYERGAMTLHALRLTIGDEAFFELVRRWAAENAGETVTTDEFIALAEEVSGQELDELFELWLFTPEQPPLPATLTATAASLTTARTSGSWTPMATALRR
jgi:aminopeptidase N